MRRATGADKGKNTSGFAISTHALHAESDYIGWRYKTSLSDFYPRSPCGERRKTLLDFYGSLWEFLPTLSMRRATVKGLYWLGSHAIFLPTLSMRRATRLSPLEQRPTVISTHALHAESDRLMFVVYPLLRKYFYPRSPCGERQLNAIAL